MHLDSDVHPILDPSSKNGLTKSNGSVDDTLVEPALGVQAEQAVSTASSNLIITIQLTSTAVTQPTDVVQEVQDSDKGFASIGAVSVDDTIQQEKQKRDFQNVVSVGNGEVDDGNRVSKHTRVSQDSTATTSESVSQPACLTKSVRLSQKQTLPSETPPSTAPHWFVGCHKLFLDANLGVDWNKLILAWSTFEERAEYTGIGRLTSTGRPNVIAQ